MSEFFFEIRSGEIPAQMQKPAAADLKRLLGEKLTALALQFGAIETYVGPRRLVAVVRDLQNHTQARTEERRGPRVDAPQQAIDGFLKTTGKVLTDLAIQETPKGNFYVLKEILPALETVKLLPDVIREMIYTLPWPKKMTWATTTRTWIRPLQGGCALYDGKKLEFTVSLNEEGHPHPHLLSFTGQTVGHRFMAPGAFEVTSFDDYVAKLRRAFVIVDHDERQRIIQEQIQGVCAKNHLSVLEDIGLLDEVTGLVEWPVCLLGSIDPRFMALPPELLRTTMRVHQRYFSVHKSDGAFAPHFIVVSNIVAPDGGQTIVTGNERVLKARLSDAAFFYDQDRKQSLQEHGAGLATTVFHADLGTLAQKQERLARIIDLITDPQDPAIEAAKTAASLCKADLMSSMVFEFPELQGIMGSYYATADGHSADVAQAIYQHYSPKGPSDVLPQGRASQLLAMADRLDTLVGFFSVGLKPTGSKDPFALRRAALGVIRFLEQDFAWTLASLLPAIFDLYDGTKRPEKSVPKDVVIKELLDFFQDRLKVYWREQGFSHDYVDAFLSQGFTVSIQDLKQRLEALVAFVKSHPQEAQDLFAGYKRAKNIAPTGAVSAHNGSLATLETLLEKDQERALFGALQTAHSQIHQAMTERRYSVALSLLAPLRGPIDAFLNDVHVHDDRADVRTNRLALLGDVQRTLETIADFSKIEE